VCRACLKQGHLARLCPRQQSHNVAPLDLRPRGNIDSYDLPKDRPHLICVCLQHTEQLAREVDRLSEAYVIDARYTPHHGLPRINRDLSRALPRSTAYQLSHLTGAYYLLMFNSHITHQEVMVICDRTLNSHGYILFLWTPALKSDEQALGYKVWLEMADLPPHC
jgi:hypothetical protein